MLDINFKYWLFELKLCEGMTNLGMLKLVNYYMQERHLPSTNEEITTIAELQGKQKERFFESHTKVIQDSQRVKNYFEQHTFLTIIDEQYPELLREIYNPPVLLFYQGNIELLRSPCLAVIGSRKATDYGKKLTEKLVAELVKKKLTIVSGLAKGIDSCAHRQAIFYQGNTIAVIGSGIDYVYPKENKQLQEQISEKQLLLSEHTLGTPPFAHHFPMRNRMIAGLSLGTCIIEAEIRSGTLITAQLALDFGREVFAVPGNALTKNSEGCHLLLQQGAKCVWKIEHIIEEIKYHLPKNYSI